MSSKKQFEYEGLEIKIINSQKQIKEFVYALDDFSEKADPDNPKEHRSYVYALCEKDGDSLIPFYIGEGKATRVWSHECEENDQIELLKEELESEGRLEELADRVSELHEKIQRIKGIKDRKGVIVKYIIKWGMTGKEAFMAESALINLLKIDGLRFDANSIEEKDKLTNKVRGHQSEGEKQTDSNEALTIEEFCERYAKDPLYYEDLQKKEVKALLININRGYSECLKITNRELRAKAIRDTACGNWKMRKIEELDKLGIEYVFATVQARIVGIYKIKKVDGRKFHYMYECVDENSEYPYGEDTVSFRNGDYENAKAIADVARKLHKNLSEMELKDMPSDYRKTFIEGIKNEKKTKKKTKRKTKDKEKKIVPATVFKNNLKRKYMILEDISKDDPNYSEYSEYLYRPVVHSDGYVENAKIEKEIEKEKALKEGKEIPDPDKVTNSIYGSGNPLKYIETSMNDKTKAYMDNAAKIIKTFPSITKAVVVGPATKKGFAFKEKVMLAVFTKPEADYSKVCVELNNALSDNGLTEIDLYMTADEDFYAEVYNLLGNGEIIYERREE